MTRRQAATYRRASTVALLLGVLVAGGCASDGALTSSKIGAADKAVTDARQSTADVLAQSDLKSAEDKLSDAKTARDAGDYRLAQQLADEALADADYARAQANTAKTRKMISDVRDSINTLRKEIDRAPAR